MAKCTVTLNVALLGRAYVGKSVVISDVEARDDGTYWTTTEAATKPLTNSPLATVDLDRTIAYAFQLPDGSSSVRMIPNAATADFSDLDILKSVPGSAGFVVDQYTWVLLSTEPLSPLAVVGQTYFETDTNVFGQIGA